MRILLITDWNRGQGGAEAYIAWLRAGLIAAGDEVRLLTSSAGAGERVADYLAFGSNQAAAQAFLQIVNPFAVATVRRALREFRPQVAVVNMFAHHLSPAPVLAIRECPVVLLVTDYKCICPIGSKLLPNGALCDVRAGWICHRNGCVNIAHWMRDRPRYALLRAALARAARVIACSEWVQRELAADGIASEVAMLPVPAPSGGFRRAPAAQPIFLFCGRLDVEKGAALLIRAFARVCAEVPDASLRIVGRGPERDSLRRLAAELRIADHLTFTGWLEPPSVEEHLAAAWALVVPSLWAEPLGLVAVEALVRGVPVIASARGGLCEVVEDGATGLLFPNGDETALAQRMLSIAQRRAFPEHILPNDAVMRTRERHAIELHVQKMRRVLSAAVGGS